MTESHSITMSIENGHQFPKKASADNLHTRMSGNLSRDELNNTIRRCHRVDIIFRRNLNYEMGPHLDADNGEASLISVAIRYARSL